MPHDQDVRLLPETEQLSVDPATAAITRVRVVRFTVGPHGPYTLQIPSDRYNPDTVMRLISTKAAEIRTVFGLKEGEYFPLPPSSFSI